VSAEARFTLEVRDEAAAKAAVQLAVDTFGRLDVLVNNAGFGQFAPRTAARLCTPRHRSMCPQPA